MFEFKITQGADGSHNVKARISGVKPTELFGAMYSLAATIAKHYKVPTKLIIHGFLLFSRFIDDHPERYKEGECVQMTIPRDIIDNIDK